MSARHSLKDLAFIAEFAAFCRGKGEEGYSYFDGNNCALCQYLRHAGLASSPTVGGDTWADVGELWGAHHIQEDVADELTKEPYTFSALADRLEALLVDAPEIVR
jgi:hypothetical protein